MSVLNESYKFIIFKAPYDKNFKIEYTADTKWQISISTPLDAATLQNNKVLQISLTATETGKTAVGKSVLILDLPESTGPEFVEHYYVAEYPEDEKGPISFETAIKFKNNVEASSIDLSGTYKCYEY